MRNDVLPTVTEEPDIGRETCQMIRHPAFGQIRASRVSGHAYLYGSDFRHQHYVTIEICRSELRRSLSNDWPFAKDEIIQVALSEAQWAAFVSTLNSGSGIQCTIVHEHNKAVPGIAANIDRQAQFKSENANHLDSVLKSLDELTKAVNALKTTNKAKEELHGHIRSAVQNLTCNLEFVADQFGEHVERTTEKAKCEISAYIEAMIHRTGIEALQGKSPLLLESK